MFITYIKYTLNVLNFYKGLHNRPFSSSPRPLYQNKVKCSAFDVEMIFHSLVNETLFHKKGCALGLMLEVRVFGTWKWPNVAGQYNMMRSFSYWACISVSLFWALNIEKLAPFLEINNENRSMKLKIIL